MLLWQSPLWLRGQAVGSIHPSNENWEYYFPNRTDSISYCSALTKFVNKAADGGITALHMEALNGYFDYVQLLLNLHANVSVVTFHYGTSMDLIGAGNTPLHYAAYGGNLKCCQILLANGASRLTLNCNG